MLLEIDTCMHIGSFNVWSLQLELYASFILKVSVHSECLNELLSTDVFVYKCLLSLKVMWLLFVA